MPGLSVSQSGKQSPSSDGAYIWTSMAPFPASFPHGRPVASHGPLHILLAQIAQISRSLSLKNPLLLLLHLSDGPFSGPPRLAIFVRPGGRCFSHSSSARPSFLSPSRLRQGRTSRVSLIRRHCPRSRACPRRRRAPEPFPDDAPDFLLPSALFRSRANCPSPQTLFSYIAPRLFSFFALPQTRSAKVVVVCGAIYRRRITSDPRRHPTPVVVNHHTIHTRRTTAAAATSTARAHA
jgi:hypothetical protein